MLQTARYAPQAPPDPSEMAGLCARLRDLSETEGRGALGDDGWAELADRITELAALARQQSFTWTMRAAELAAADAAGFERCRTSHAAGRHRVPRQRRAQSPLWPRAVPSVIPLAKAAAAVTATAAAVTAVAVGAHPAAAPHARSWHAPHGSAAASLAPADAVPVVVPEPSYRPRHASLDADSSRPVTVSVDPSWRPPRSRPARSSPQPPAPAAAAGILDVATLTLDPGLSGTAELDFSAEGGAVQWWAWASPGVELSASTGTLEAGQPMALTVTLEAGTPGGTIWISAGGQTVAVPVTG